METKLITNYELQITNYFKINRNKGFTIIETLVIISISVMLMVVVGGVMTSSYKVTNSTEGMETTSHEAQVILAALKKNIFDAEVSGFVCPVTVGTSISFVTKGGGQTTLFCDEVVGKIASISAQSGSFRLINDGVSVRNCSGFVSCQYGENERVSSVDFNLDIGMTGGLDGNKFWNFVSSVVVR